MLKCANVQINTCVIVFSEWKHFFSVLMFVLQKKMRDENLTKWVRLTEYVALTSCMCSGRRKIYCFFLRAQCG